MKRPFPEAFHFNGYWNTLKKIKRANKEIRTPDLTFTKRLLYRLSYVGTFSEGVLYQFPNNNIDISGRSVQMK